MRCGISIISSVYFIAATIFFPLEIKAQMSMGFNFQDIGWCVTSDGTQPEYIFFRDKGELVYNDQPLEPDVHRRVAAGKSTLPSLHGLGPDKWQ
jgi:hypothetical protein